MGYRPLIDIHVSITFNFNKQKPKKKQQQQQPDKPSSSSNKDKDEHNKEKTEIVTNSSSCRPYSVLVAQPHNYAVPYSFYFFIVDENKRWKTSRKLAIVNMHLASITRSTPYSLLRRKSCTSPTLILSYRGILLFRLKFFSPFSPELFSPELALAFYNPCTGEQVTLTVPCKTYLYCGFFFHSPTQEYRVLYQLRQDRAVVEDTTSTAAGSTGGRYALLGIRSGSLRQIRNSSCPNCHPDISTPPVFSNGALHWMTTTEIKDDEEYLPKEQRSNRSGHVYDLPIKCSETIMSFGMESEEFRVIPHPGADDELCSSHNQQKIRHQKQMKLLEMDGKLCLCDGSYYRRKLDIWVMEDYKKGIWAKRYVVRLDKLLPFSHCAANHRQVPWVKAVCIHNGSLVFQWHSWYTNWLHKHDHMMYDLEKGGRLRKFKDWKLQNKRDNFGLAALVTHTPSLETTGRKSGCVLSLYEDDNGNSELVEYDYEHHQKE